MPESPLRDGLVGDVTIVAVDGYENQVTVPAAGFAVLVAWLNLRGAPDDRRSRFRDCHSIHVLPSSHDVIVRPPWPAPTNMGTKPTGGICMQSPIGRAARASVDLQSPPLSPRLGVTLGDLALAPPPTIAPPLPLP